MELEKKGGLGVRRLVCEIKCFLEHGAGDLLLKNELFCK